MKQDRGDRGRGIGRVLAGMVAAGILIAVTAGPGPGQEAGSATPRRTTYVRPSVSLEQYVEAGADSIRAWQKATAPSASNRTALYGATRELLRMYHRVEDRVAKTYPRDQVEWILITDSVADSLTEALSPLLQTYRTANPEEILTQGRQLVEADMASIVGPPSRMLGLHIVLLADRIGASVDSIRAGGLTTDEAGLEEAYLRHLDDWVQLYEQVHSDAISTFRSRLSQEDWIMARLKDNCGNSGGGTWKLVQQWMSLVEYDSSQTPPAPIWAHEYHLKANECPGDTRVVYIDLPNYDAVQKEFYELQQEGKLGPQGEEGR